MLLSHRIFYFRGYSITFFLFYNYRRVAELTSRFIGSRSKLFEKKSVLELGCGLGLCGIVAGILI